MSEPSMRCSVGSERGSVSAESHVCPQHDRGEPRPEEETARVALSSVIPERIVAYDDRSEDRMWDFCLVDAEGAHAGALEVTAHVNRDLLEFNIAHERDGDDRLPPPFVRSSWCLYLEHDTRIKRLPWGQVYELLREAEARGDGGVGMGQSTALDVRMRLQALGIRRAIPWDNDPDPRIVRVMPASSGWWGEHVDQVTAAAIAEVIANERKLKDAPGPRHLFVWIDGTALPAYFGMRADGAFLQSDVAQVLPSFLDAVWVACGDQREPERTALWRIDRERMQWDVVRPFPGE